MLGCQYLLLVLVKEGSGVIVLVFELSEEYGLGLCWMENIIGVQKKGGYVTLG